MPGVEALYDRLVKKQKTFDWFRKWLAEMLNNKVDCLLLASVDCMYRFVYDTLAIVLWHGLIPIPVFVDVLCLIIYGNKNIFQRCKLFCLYNSLNKTNLNIFLSFGSSEMKMVMIKCFKHETLVKKMSTLEKDII